MARNPRMKLAALAVAAIASLGMIAASPAAASHAGGGKIHSMRSGDWCC